MHNSQRHTSGSEPAEKLYFAYGSNLSFEQMAKRCPQSRFIGRGRLYQHQFQINERGYANIVYLGSRNPDAFVDGLCYLLAQNDETNLDRAEGVPTAYSKKILDIEFFPAPISLLGRLLTEIVQRPILPTPLQQLATQTSVGGEITQALVYLSSDYVQPGLPWDEYIQRMELGLQNALALGISSAYVENDVGPTLKTGRGVRKAKDPA
ncbi:hypothetical protein TWF694_006332 [Orbilia ellipsospora]|uniref:gamma-glutamylcyclotransferase n=1 Tax=Orbilia ellipsospora TaxID=2528407 RepID=A0AAV9XJS7_9PEZI